MFAKSLLRVSSGASRALCILSSTNSRSSASIFSSSSTLSSSSNITSTPSNRGGLLSMNANTALKDQRHNIHNNIFIVENCRLGRSLLDTSLSRESLVYYSSDSTKDGKGDKIKDADVNSDEIKDISSGDMKEVIKKEKDMKEDWEEEGLVCEYCDIGFASEEALQTHLDLTGKKGGGGCRGLWLIRNKADVNAGKLKHVCDFGDCRIGFKTKSHLEEHKAGHSEERPFVCSKCGSSYKLQSHLNRHVRQKHSGQVFECPECDKHFNSEGEVKTHLKSCRQEEKDFKCSQCGVKFHTNGHLTRHIKIVHNKERPHKCELCDEAFSTKGILKRHMRSVHEKAKPHQCEDCSATFTTARELKTHRIRHHTFDWPHTCHVCEERGIVKGYIAPGRLEKHMKAQHPEEYQEQLEREKPAVCHVCDKRFRSDNEVNIHIKKKHNQL